MDDIHCGILRDTRMFILVWTIQVKTTQKIKNKKRNQGYEFNSIRMPKTIIYTSHTRTAPNAVRAQREWLDTVHSPPKCVRDTTTCKPGEVVLGYPTYPTCNVCPTSMWPLFLTAFFGPSAIRHVPASVPWVQLMSDPLARVRTFFSLRYFGHLKKDPTDILFAHILCFFLFFIFAATYGHLRTFADMTRTPSSSCRYGGAIGIMQ